MSIDLNQTRLKDEKKLDETGIEPVTFCLQGRRATNYATRPFYTELILENK